MRGEVVGSIALAAVLLLATAVEGGGFHNFRHSPRNYAPDARSAAEAPSVPIVFDESSFPAELLKSAAYDVVDGLPDNFIWYGYGMGIQQKEGAATASYQVEGAVSDDGSGISNWHVFSHERGRVNHNDNGDTADDQYHRFRADIKLVNHNDNGDIADDQYHRFRDDIKLCADMGLTAYRISLSWSRIMPTGELPINQQGIDHYNAVIDTIIDNGMEGIDYYNAVIDTIIYNGMEPLVTIFHWDLPMALQDKYAGWLSPKIQDIFAVYAEECFKAFGDRVKYWLSFNEPWSFVRSGYSSGNFPPGRCSDRALCEEGNSGTETYVAGHNVINSHAKATAIYMDKYAKQQGGSVGITLNCDWAEPLTSTKDDAAAAQRFLEFRLGWFADPFQLGWFADPVFFGKYPPSMVERVGSRLPTFTPEEAALLRKTAPSFFGLNHYSTNFAADRLAHMGLKGKQLQLARQAEIANNPGSWGKQLQLARQAEIANNPGSWDSDIGAVFSSVDANGDQIGPTGDSPWLHVVPWGLRKLLNWVHDRYETPILITENGCDVPGENALGLPFVLRDPFRIKYYQGYLSNVNLAVKEDNVPVIGYFAWSLLDNFEWADGYSKRFGLVYVDYPTQQRYPKASAAWYSKLVRVQRQGSNGSTSNDLIDTAVAGGASTGGDSQADATAALPSLLAMIAAVAVAAGMAVAGAAHWQRQRSVNHNLNRNLNSAQPPSELRRASEPREPLFGTPRALAEGLKNFAKPDPHSYEQLQTDAAEVATRGV
ncbi:glycoside hydrolase superfamily [Tribonema minus]|uniref:Glycoside hydrolase superfamily n=1 Tax=Tribonema minus TaxID=303371 RepID=A0A836CF81_9STRA|nr:glycoside hydrolase superfamily [Tribonema minus]